MFEPTDLRKTSEVWKFTAPPPSCQTIFIEVEYGQTPDDILFTIYLDELHERPDLTEPEARAITATLNELHIRLGIPKGDNKC